MGTRKRYLSGLLAAALALTLLTGGQPVWAAQAPGGEDTSDMAVESAFSDVEAGAWYAGAVEYCVESGLMNGVSGDRFDPVSYTHLDVYKRQVFGHCGSECAHWHCSGAAG